MKEGGSSFLVILILLSLGILIGVFIYIFDPLSGYYKKQDQKRVSDLQKVASALHFYYRDFGKYPEYVDNEFFMKVRDKNYKWGSEWKPYLDLLPQDPVFYKRYAYWVDRNNNYQSFKLYTALDRPDLLGTSCGTDGCSNTPFENMCGMYALCNFGITSGNISP